LDFSHISTSLSGALFTFMKLLLQQKCVSNFKCIILDLKCARSWNSHYLSVHSHTTYHWCNWNSLE